MEIGIGDRDWGLGLGSDIGDLKSYYLTRIRLQLLRCFLNGRAFFSGEAGKLIPRPVACKKLLTDQIASRLYCIVHRKYDL